jgi:hypothetical protein
VRLNISAFLTDYNDLHIRQAVLTGGVAIVNVPRQGQGRGNRDHDRPGARADADGERHLSRRAHP